ncbi:hypothetical protein NHE_0286 [Neorickettsia helminthoeca str. Oregon]|uniref:Uncharacterized protein n=1 Tax=Neorickettsia helminthoeca str. Oregon TaxID=1286528 RepID=X5HLH4_9RICK|nr:hypothetical protein NHE_0286 [Neorickettsia helminthoeca str. Oregon]
MYSCSACRKRKKDNALVFKREFIKEYYSEGEKSCYNG